MKRYWLPLSLLLNVGLIIVGLLAVQRLGGWQYLWHRFTQPPSVNGTYDNRKQLFDMLPERDSSIIMLGNSITEQGNWTELLKDDRFVNRGIAGDVVNGIRSRLEPLERLRPRRIYLMVGVNDLLFHPPEAIFPNYQTLVRELQRRFPETELILQSILPVNNEVRRTGVENVAINTLNTAIRRLAEERQLTYLDVHAQLRDERGALPATFTADGIHLNGLAYLRWAELIRETERQREAAARE